MLVAPIFVALGYALVGLAAPVDTQAISTAVYDELVFYFRYASSAYDPICPRPNGNTLVTRFNDLVTDTTGYIVRDDTRKEIVVAFRGSFSLRNFITDARVLLKNYESPGVSPPPGTKVHSGFLAGYNAVAGKVIEGVKKQLKDHPDYSVVTTGHSLGGALSSLGAVSLKANLPSSTNVTMYTYGQPRTGNQLYAFWVNEHFGDKAFRGVHTRDGVPTMVPRLLGYHHHGIEYWTSKDPSSAENTKQCDREGEDPSCSDSISPSGGINLPHTRYYNILASTPFCL